jgi:capsular exopolysaccharide synthesis family protein
MDINAYIKPLVKWWRLLVVVTVLAAISSFLSVLFQPEVYVSRTTLMIGRTILDPNPDSGQIFIASQLASIYADMAKREPIQTATMEALEISWLPSYQVGVVPDTQLIEISVTDTNPQRAQIIANEIANQLMSQSPALSTNETGQQRRDFIEQQLSSLEIQIQDAQNKIEELQGSLAGLNSASQIARTEAEISDLADKLNTLRESYATLASNSQEGALNILTPFEPANLPTSPVGTNKLLIVALASMVGFFLAAGAAYLIEYLDRTIKTTSDVERVFNFPVIGYLSQMSENGNNATYVTNHPNSLIAESFRLIQTNLEFFQAYSSARTILVTSPTQGNGKTTIAVNLALSIALTQDKVILMDADLRRPAVHEALGIPKSPGLSEIIRNKMSVSETIQSIKHNKIDVITVGNIPPNVTEVVGSKRIASILDNLKESFETIIVDAPPLVISDAYTLASKVDGVVLVLEPGQLREEQARVIKEQFTRSGAKIIGIVFNRVTTGDAKSYGDYQYLSMYSPQHYNDYISNAPRAKPVDSRAKKLFAFFERGEVPPEVTAEVESAITAIKTQPRNLLGRVKKPKNNGKS